MLNCLLSCLNGCPTHVTVLRKMWLNDPVVVRVQVHIKCEENVTRKNSRRSQLTDSTQLLY